MKHKLLFVLLTAMVVALIAPQSVQANGIVPPPKPFKPAAGSWSWDNEDVTGTVIPQYQLAPTNDDDYALLQSAGLHVNGAAQLCHPYPGGQFGWNAEIRVLTSAGWQSVPTVNQWVPDEEGKFMTCANVWSTGTYAVFGYWEKYDGWNDQFCATLPVLPSELGWEWVYVSSAATFDWNTISVFDGNSPFLGTTGDRCSAVSPGAIETDHLIVFGTDNGPSGPMWFPGLHCGCGSVYQVPLLPAAPPQVD